MAKIDFKELSPDEVAVLSGKDKINYEKWFAKQGSDQNQDEVEDNEGEGDVTVEPIVQVNTSVYGHLYPGKKVKVSSAIAEQLEKKGLVKIV